MLRAKNAKCIMDFTHIRHALLSEEDRGLCRTVMF